MTDDGEQPKEESKFCNACSEDLLKDKFSKKQWLGSVTKQRRCKCCVESDREMIVASAIPAAQQQSAQRKSKKKTRSVPTYAGNQKEGCFKPTNSNSNNTGMTVKLASDICSWCGKTEENVKLLECSSCKNILYCSNRCYKAAYPEHKLVCDQMKKDRKLSKKQGQRTTTNNSSSGFGGSGGGGSRSLSEASGVGSFFINCEPIDNTTNTPGSGNGNLCMLTYNGELRGEEEPGQYFASDASRYTIQKLLGPLPFTMFHQSMQDACIADRGSFKRTEFYSNIDEIKPIDLFLLSCGPLNDIDRAKSTLSVVLDMISMSGFKPDGSVPNIGDIKVRGYGLNALEWAARRGNYDIAEWLASDSRTRMLVTQADSAPVAWACYTNRVELAKMLIDQYGADSHSTTEVVFGYKPPSHLASENGKLLALKFLVEECGHDIFECDTVGQDIRASLRKNNRAWMDVDGCVACDEYAKEKGVEGEIIRSGNRRRQNESSSNNSRQQQESSLEEKLSAALRRLEFVGGKENETDDDDDDNPGEYLNELVAVGDARYELGQYNEAGGIYYRSYYAAMHHNSNNTINNPTTFPIAHKMLQSWMKSNDEHYIKQAFGMAKQTCMMPGCPPYIREDLKQVEKIMTKKGIKMEWLF